MERSVPLKEKFNVTKSSLRNKSHGSPRQATGVPPHSGWEADAGGRGHLHLSLYWGEQGRAEQGRRPAVARLGGFPLASGSKGCLPLLACSRTWVIAAEEYCLWARERCGSGVVRLRIKGALLAKPLAVPKHWLVLGRAVLPQTEGFF